MSLGNRIAALVLLGVMVAGLAHAGWLASFSLVAQSAASLDVWLLPVGSQVLLTVTLAAALGWSVRRELVGLREALRSMQGQLEALREGRFVLCDAPPVLELVPLAHSLNDAVRRLQLTLDAAPSQTVDALRRSARTDTGTGLDSRNNFLRKLIERLADSAVPDTSLVVLRLLTEGSDSDTAPGVFGERNAADVLQVYAERVHGAFAGRLSDGDFALCLPAHGVVEDSAHSVLAGLKATVLGRNCAIAALDGLGGAGLSSVLSLIESTLDCAAAAGQGNIELRSGTAEPSADGADGKLCRQIVEALAANQIRLAEFPVVDASGRLLHLECPTRIRLEAQGRFEPAQHWLAVASRNRLMTQVDLAGVELALEAIAADGRARCVHVAAESVATAGFVTAVGGRLEAAPAAAAQLWIEISELSFERLPPRLRNAGTAWRRCGARVGIEHAGAALRSLVRLDELELDYVKVDRSFVQGLAGDTLQRERAQGLVAFAHEIGCRVIAEGVDDADELPALWRLGFNGASGRAVTRQWQADQAERQATSPA